MALVIAGERSGVGKTTVTLAMLAFLQAQGLAVQSFKVGPDYIDPMFHSFVTRRPCRNLDSILTSDCYVQQCFKNHIQTVDYGLVEGVMGLFDGISGTDDRASTAQIAQLLDLPILLVVDCSRLSRSVAAIVHGYRSFDPRLKLAGVILNRVGSDRHLELLKEALEPLHLPILGVFRRHESITIPDRHLGLVPTAELPHLQTLLDRLVQLAQESFDWEHLLPLLAVSSSERTSRDHSEERGQELGQQLPIPTGLKIGVARDPAFNFYYQDNLDLLNHLGAELLEWSPLEADQLPTDLAGLYLGGGFPEVFAAQLSENVTLRQSLKTAIAAGLPVYAECGGLMYLCESITDLQGESYPMVGVLPTAAVMSSTLTLGYRQVTALRDSPLLPAGACTWGHEFHRSQLNPAPQNALFESCGLSASRPPYLEGWQIHQVHASYTHLHFGASPMFARRFLQQCYASCSCIYTGSV